MNENMMISNTVWTEADKQYLRENWFKYGPDYIGYELGRTADAVSTMAERLNIKTYRRGGYSKYDVEFLTKNAGVMTAKDIAESLGKSHQSVHQKAMKLGLSLRVVK